MGVTVTIKLTDMINTCTKSIKLSQIDIHWRAELEFMWSGSFVPRLENWDVGSGTRLAAWQVRRL